MIPINIYNYEIMCTMYTIISLYNNNYIAGFQMAKKKNNG